MRYLISCLILPVLLSTLHADDGTTVKAILDKAIEAQVGSSENLGKLRRIESLAKGTMKSPMGELIATREILVQWIEKPEKFRLRVGMELTDGKRTVQLLFDDLNKGFRRVGPASEEMSIEEVRWISRDIYASWIATLLPLKESSFTLTALPEIKIDGVPQVGLKVEKKLRPTIELYFDAKTSLLTRMTYIGLEAGVDVKKEFRFSNYKEFDKVMLPTKEIEQHDGRKRNEWTISSYRFPEKIDPKEFEQ